MGYIAARDPYQGVKLLYRGVLNREPDEGGFSNYLTQIMDPESLDKIIDEMSGCRENKERLVKVLYIELLDREADPGGLEGYATA